MFKKALIAGAMLVSAIGANAAGTATFGVTGGSTPGTCDITVAGGGVADLGIYTNAQMHALPNAYGTHYVLPQKQIGFSVTCGAPTRAVISISDNKAGKILAMDGNDSRRFGLTDQSGAPLGVYFVSLLDTVIDNVAAAAMLQTLVGTSNWAANPWLDVLPGYSTGFIKTAGNTIPDMFQTLTANLGFNLYVGKNIVDSATNAVTFVGGGVITMTYI